MANAIALRQDVHTELDKGTVIFVRKLGEWVAHFLTPTRDLGPESHNVPIDMPAVVRETFILTNILKAILPRISNFFIRGEKRRVIVKRGTEPPLIREMTSAEIRTMLEQSKCEHSKSPRKRPRHLDELGDTPDEKRPCLVIHPRKCWRFPQHRLSLHPLSLVNPISAELQLRSSCYVSRV